MSLPILIWPHPKLAEISRDVTPEELASDEFKIFVDQMLETVQEHQAIGLSAVQVGRPLRVFVTNVAGQQAVYINPKVREFMGESELLDEGCLSIPGITVEDVPRFVELVLLSVDHAGTEVVTQLEGLEAQCAQHELEHFDGKLLVDRFGPVKRDVLKRKVRKHLKRSK